MTPNDEVQRPRHMNARIANPDAMARFSATLGWHSDFGSSNKNFRGVAASDAVKTSE